MVPQSRLDLKRFFREDVKGSSTQPAIVQGSHYLQVGGHPPPQYISALSMASAVENLRDSNYLLLIANVSPAKAHEADTIAGGQKVAS